MGLGLGLGLGIGLGLGVGSGLGLGRGLGFVSAPRAFGLTALAPTCLEAVEAKEFGETLPPFGGETW